ncbi:MAG: hypothetical protein F6J97_04220 [Leptolyngbya sp. SIO4C1]|nr:hypothetical protein [Leptolyngbya sp. SIO4C1]
MSQVLASQRWEGTGRIIRGAGKGATVPALQIETEADRVSFLSGPDAGEQVQLSEAETAETDMGTWQFSTAGNALEVIFYQDDPYRVIHYRLARD